MNNLIKNELTKIFHKKAIYIVLIITLAFTILNCVLEKLFSNEENFIYGDVDSIKESMNSLDRNDPEQLNIYYSLSAQVQTIELAQKYKKDSWQRYIIYNRAQSIIENMIKNANTEEYEYFKKIYDEFVKALENDDWTIFAKEELEKTNDEINSITSQSEEEIKFQEDKLQLLNDQKQALQWRIEKNIPYGNTARSIALDGYANTKEELRGLEQQQKIKKLTQEQKIQKQQLESDLKLYEHAIQNNIDSKVEITEINNQSALATTADARLAITHHTYSMFITIIVIIIAGTAISEESNKGTIKLLLVRPYKRTKILVAKFISCLIVLLFTYIVTALFQAIVGGFTYGFSNYLGKIIIYNFTSAKVETLSTIRYLILTGLAILPEILLLLTLSFTISTILNNSPVAIALPLLGTMASDIINQLFLHYKKAQFLKYFVTPNWDLRMYLFGKIPQYENLTLTFSLLICLIYFTVMIILSHKIFQTRDIKNV